MAYPRALLEQLGGFDERFAKLAEDTDLGLRAIKAGASFRYLGDALVWHAVLPQTLSGAVRQARRRDAIPALVRRHPEQRAAVYRSIFWKRSHAFLLLAVAGLATRRPAVAVISALPWLSENTDPRSLRGPRRAGRQAAYLVARAAVDAVEVAATTAAAIRERTLII
jgi:GT2 family glycosyltransferase